VKNQDKKTKDSPFIKKINQISYSIVISKDPKMIALNNPNEKCTYSTELNAKAIQNDNLLKKSKVKIKPRSNRIDKMPNKMFRRPKSLKKMKNDSSTTQKLKLETPTNSVFENLFDKNEGTLNDISMPSNDTSLQGKVDVAVYKTFVNSPSTCARVVATTNRMNSNHELEIPLFASDNKEYCINSNQEIVFVESRDKKIKDTPCEQFHSVITYNNDSKRKCIHQNKPNVKLKLISKYLHRRFEALKKNRFLYFNEILILYLILLSAEWHIKLNVKNNGPN
jgi:hypothetical protein